MAQPKGWQATRAAYLLLLLAAVAATVIVDVAAIPGDDDSPRLWGWVQPEAQVTATLISGLWVAALVAFYVPRRKEGRPIGVVLVTGLALIALVGGFVSFLPWSGDQDPILTPVWRTLRLFAGDASGPYGTDDALPPVALQIARTAAIAASFATAALAALLLFRRQWDRFVSRFLHYADVVIGCDESSVPLVQRLVDDPERAGRIGVLVSPGAPDKLRRELASVRAFVVEADPLNPSVVGGMVTKPGLREKGLAVERVYVVDPDPVRARVLAGEVCAIVAGASPLKDRAVQVIIRQDDAEQAWKVRLDELTASPNLVVDAIVPAEVTASEVLGKALREPGSPSTLVVCGDTELSAAFLREADRRYREAVLLEESAQKLPRGASRSDLKHDERDILTLEDRFARVVIVDPSAHEILAAHEVQRGSQKGPELRARAGSWEVELPTLLKESASPCVVVISDDPAPKGWQVAVRCAQVTVSEIWYHGGTGQQGGQSTGLPNLHEFAISLLFLGWLPDTTWSRIGRLQNERYRRIAFKLENGKLPESRLPWWHGDPAVRLPMWRRRDNIDQARCVMVEIQKQGYRWVRSGGGNSRAGFAGDWDAVCKVEHERWVKVQTAHGFHASPTTDDPDGKKLNKTCVHWGSLTENDQKWVRSNVGQVLETISVFGYVPVPNEEKS